MTVLKPFGGYTWSNHGATDQPPSKLHYALMGGGAGLGLSALAMSMRPNDLGARPLDAILNTTKFLSNLSPYQVTNTLGIPEFGSLLASPAHLGFEQHGADWIYRLSGAHAANSSSFAYLKALTGQDDAWLAARGISPGMVQGASSLEFTRPTSGLKGSIHSVFNGERHLLTNDVMFMDMAKEASTYGGLHSPAGGVNRPAHAMFQAMEMWGKTENFKPNSVFTAAVAGADEVHFNRSAVLPVPAFGASIKGSTILRAIPAFSMERFNRLLQNAGEQFMGEGLKAIVERIPGLHLGVTPGGASSMYLRFGIAAAGVFGAGVGIQQLDWIRRQTGLVGHIGVSSIFAGGVAGLTHKAGFSSRASLFAGTAAFFGQTILPGFSKGMWPGIVGTGARLSEVKSLAINPFNYQRRVLEGYLPGISDWKVGAALGLGVLGLTTMKIPGSNDYATDWLYNAAGHQRLKMLPGVSRLATTRDRFWSKLAGETSKGETATILDRMNLLRKNLSTKGFASTSKRVGELWSSANRDYIDSLATHPANKLLVQELESISHRYVTDSIASKLLMHGEGLLAMGKYGFFGATLHEAETSKSIRQLGFHNPLGTAGLLFFGALGAHQLLTGGLLGSTQSYSDLRAEHTGRKMVAVKKGRYWEGGPTPYEGAETAYYRPSAVALVMNRVRQKGLWGADEDRRSPIAKFFIKNFTYKWEEEHYWDRPAPISAPAFEGVPILGPILGSTIGRFIKPPKLMHSEEFMQAGKGGPYFAHLYQGWRREGTGNFGGGAMKSPYTFSNRTSDLYSQFSEMEGLTGWLRNVTLRSIGGTRHQDPRMFDSGYGMSLRRQFQETALGGMFFSNELIRRIVPSYSGNDNRQNPLVNQLPTWLPKQLRFGDQYSQLPWGEARLPGPGYEALHPEIAGMDPQEYPDLYKYDILSSVAPFSQETSRVQKRVYKQRASGVLSKQETAMVDDVDKRLKDRWDVFDFNKDDGRSIRLPGSSATRALWGGAQHAVRALAAPLEFLLPFGLRPVHKLLGGSMGPIESYRYNRLYGSSTAFWDAPWRDSIRPAFYSLAHLGGYNSKPLWRLKADADQEYWDKLEFYKWINLAHKARAGGDKANAIRFEYQAASTRYGVNPQGDPIGIYWSLPSDERKYFNAFALATGKDRKRILSMVPADERHLYQALWSRKDSGKPITPGADSGVDRPYLEAQFNHLDTKSFPPVDWVGYKADVQLSDIRVRYIQELGKDIHQYGEWESTVARSEEEPFLEGSTQYIQNSRGFRGEISRMAEQLTSWGNGDYSQVNVIPSNMTTSSVYLYNQDNRVDDTQAAVKQRMGY